MTDQKHRDQSLRDDGQSRSDHAEIVALIHDYFAAQLSPEREQKMRAHLRDCADCRAVYDAQANAEQRVLGVQESQSLANQRVLQSVMQHQTLQGAVTREKETQTSCVALRFWRQILAFGLGSTALAAALFVLVINPQFLASQQQAGLRSRGLPTADSSVGLGLSGVRADGTIYDARRPEGLSLDDNLRFSYSNNCTDEDKAARYLFVFGLDENLQPYWYYPLPNEGSLAHPAQSIAIESGPQVLQRDLPYETALKQRHHVGKFWVFALFSREPIKLVDVEQKIRQARQQKVKIRDISWPSQMSVSMQVQRQQIQIVSGAK